MTAQSHEQRFTAASLRYDLSDSWSAPAGAPYLLQVQLDPDIMTFHVPLGTAKYLTRVAVMIEPAGAHAAFPASTPKVSVYGVSAFGVSTLLAESDDTDLALVLSLYEAPHVVGKNSTCSATPQPGGSHDHLNRGVLVNASVAAYSGLRITVRGESGGNSVSGLKIHSLVLGLCEHGP
jgi:hypothetical protein